MSSDESTAAPEQPVESPDAPTSLQTSISTATDKLTQHLGAAPVGAGTKWAIGLAITLVGSLAYPVATGVSTYASKRATEETKTAKQEAVSYTHLTLPTTPYV